MNETPQQAARRFSAKAIKDGFKPEALHEYKGTEGNIIYRRMRLKHPDGRKWIRPMRRNGHGYELGEPEFPNGKPLYRLPELPASPNDPVWFVEGEWAADHLARIGVLATTSGSAESAKHADFSPLANRRVNIWPDNDESGLRHAREVRDRLIELGATVRLVDVAKLNLPPKGDVVNWLALHPKAAAADIEALPAKDYQKARKTDKTSSFAPAEPPRKSQATRLVELAENVSLFHDDDQAYAHLRVAEHAETWALRSKRFRDYLTRQFYLAEQRAPSAQAIEDALRTLSGKAMFEADQCTVHRRIAGCNGNIYIDLVDAQWRVIEVSPNGWKVIEKSPVRFIRSPGMKPLPQPQLAASVDVLWDYITISDSLTRSLILAYLVAALRPVGPYPALVFQGEQGTGKSTAAKVLRALVDPSAVPLRTMPRDERDLMIAARNGWVIALDNLSGLSPWLSDALCRIATGGGFSTRELYSDTDEVLIDVQRPIILNGIDDIASRQDLIDRSIIINLDPIKEESRKAEAAFWRDFERDQPFVLGALLDRLSQALKELPKTRLDSLPRMADFALWAEAAEPKDEKGAFIEAYRDNRQSAIESGLEGSPVAGVLRDLLNKEERFEGTATDLSAKLNHHASEHVRQSRSWPRSPKALGSQLARLATALRAVGIDITRGRDGKIRTRTIHIRKDGNNASGTSATSATTEKQQHRADKADVCGQQADIRRTFGGQAEKDVTHCFCEEADKADKADAKIRTHSNCAVCNGPCHAPATEWTAPDYEVIPDDAEIFEVLE